MSHPDSKTEAAGLLRVIRDSHSHPVLIIDPLQMRITDVNEAACARTGYSREALLQIPPECLSLLHTRELLAAIFGERSDRPDQNMVIPFWLQHRNKRVEETELHLWRITAGGQPVVIAVLHPLPDHEVPETGLRDSAHLSSLFREAPVAMAVFRGPDHIFEAANPLFLSIAGKKDVIGKPYRMVFPEVEGQGYYEQLDQIFHTQKPFNGSELLIPVTDPATSELADHYMTYSLQPFREANGTPGGTFFFGVEVTEQVVARKRILASEVRLRALIEHSNDMLCLFDSDGTIRYMSPLFERMYRLPAADPGSILQVVLSDDRQQVHGHIKQLLNSPGVPLPIRLRNLKPDGSVIWIEGTMTNLLDVEAVQAIVLNTREITERIRAEERLQQLQSNLLASQRISHTGSWELLLRPAGQEEVPVLWSEETYRIFGYEPGEIAVSQEFFYSRLPLADRIRIQEYLGQLRQQPAYHIEHRIIRKDGSERIICAQGELICDPVSGQPVKLVGTLKDITQRKEQEAALVRSEAKLRSIFDNTTTSYTLLDRELNIVAFNQAAYAGTLQEKGQQLSIGRSILDYTTGERRTALEGRYRSVLAGEKQSYEITFRPDAADFRYYQVNLFPVYSAGGAIFGMGLAIDDITAQKVSEAEQLHKNEQLRSLTAHLQNIREEERAAIAREIHDELGQQLTGLKMEVSWLRKQLEADCPELREKVSQLLPLINETITTVRRISTDLRPGILDDFGLINALEWQAAEFEKRSGIRCRFQSDLRDEIFDKPISITLFRVFQETLTNVARHAEASQVHASICHRQGQIELTISDDGIGFDPKKVKRKHTLGLMGMQERTAMVQGRYQISSREGMGTTTYVSVPYPLPVHESQL